MRKSRLSRQQQGKLMEHFVAGTTARTAAGLVRVNKTAAAYYYHRLQDLIYQAIEDATPFTGEIEVDESVLAATAEANVARVWRARCRSLAC
jgi:transposase